MTYLLHYRRFRVKTITPFEPHTNRGTDTATTASAAETMCRRRDGASWIN
jgi:hypothetical protein